MIHINDGYCEVKGTGIRLLAELSELVHYLVHDSEISMPKELVLEAVRVGVKSDEEIHLEVIKAGEELQNLLRKEAEKKENKENPDDDLFKKLFDDLL